MEIPCATVELSREGGSRVHVHGDIDFRNAKVVREAVHSAAREAGDPIVLDLRSLTFIDSSGISALVRAARVAREQGQTLRLEGVSQHVRYLLSAAGFARFFQMGDGLACGLRIADWGSGREEGGRLGEAAAASTACTPDPQSAIRNPQAASRRVWQHACFAIPGRIELVSHIRKRVSEMLESMAPDEQLLEAVRLAVGEAASNAVRHGCRGDERLLVRVQSATDGDTLVVEISDPGPGFNPDEVPCPEVGELREGGMGIYFMRLTMDHVTYSFEGGTTVRLVKRLTE